MYPALLPLIRTPRLPVVDSTDAPADLNGLVRFAERRNMVFARVPSHFNWPLHEEWLLLRLLNQPSSQPTHQRTYDGDLREGAGRHSSICLVILALPLHWAQ
jgi:hypothetical protein